MMKYLWNILLASIFVVTSTTIPLTPAYAVGGSTIVKAGEELKIMFSQTTSVAGKTLLARLVNAEGKTVQTLVSEATPIAQLRNFYPSKISKELKAAQAEANAMAAKQANKFSVARVMKEKMLSFPMESTGFFLALGAVMTFELIFNESRNPMGYQHLAMQQMDPVGQLAFYFFMVANGATAEPLMAAVQNGNLSPRLGKYIPFFGMGVGSVASNIVHELGHAPNLWKCVGVLMSSGGLDPACDEAAKTWHERGGVNGIANEWGPGLLSLAGSVVISGWIQKGLGKAGQLIRTYVGERGIVTLSIRLTANWTAVQVLKVVGVEIGTLFIPGGGIAKVVIWGLKAAAFIGNLFLFTEVEERIRRPILFAYKNAWDQGPAFRDLEQDLIAGLLRMKENQWQPDPAKKPLTEESTDLDAKLDEFKKLMEAWRQTNMAGVLEAHANWEQKISQLSLYYKGSYNFYSDYVNNQYEKLKGEFKDQYQSGQATIITDRIFPMYGVPAPTITDATAYLSAPDMVEGAQMKFIEKTISDYSSGKLFTGANAASTISRNLTEAEKTIVAEMLQGLHSKDSKVVGRTLDQISCQVRFRWDASLVPCKYPLLSTGEPLKKHLDAIYMALGEPKPQWKRGEGYVTAFEALSEHKSIAESTEYQHVWVPFSTIRMGDSLLASMVFGPDAERGEKVIEEVNGFQANFLPPRIDNYAGKLLRLRVESAPLRVPRLFDVPISPEGYPDRVYSNAYEYLQAAGLRKTILNDSPEAFRIWWTQWVENPFVMAWADYEQKYQKIIKDLVSSLWETQDSFANRGIVANGIMQSLKQEYNLYLLVLGEILKDKLIHTQGQINSQLLTDKKDQNIWNLLLHKDRPDLFAFLRRDNNLQFSEMMKVQGIRVPIEVRHTGNQNFLWQEAVLKDMNAMESLLAQIKPIEVLRDGRKTEATKTTVSNSKFTEISQNSTKTLEVIRDTFFKDGNQLGITFNDFEKKLIASCFEGLTSVGSQVVNLGLAANAVSYTARQDGGLVNPRCVQAPQGGGAGIGAKSIQYIQAELTGCK